MSISPPLTSLDRRVLAMIEHRPRRARYIAEKTRQPLSDIRLILRGLEHLGYVRQSGGWWRLP